MTYTAPSQKTCDVGVGTQTQFWRKELVKVDTELDAHALLIAAAAGGAGSALASTKIIVGNGAGTATAVSMSNDATLANTGALTIAANAITTAKIIDAAVTEAKLAGMSTEGLHTARIARTVYDFASDGGLIGTILLGATLPVNSRVTKFWYEVVDTLESLTDAATVTIGIPTDDATGLVGTIAISAGGNVWDEGLHAGIQDGAVGNMSEKCTAARALTMTIAAEDLTAGKIVFFAEYVVSA